MKLTRLFYSRPTLTVARELLGQILVRRSPQGTCAGIIVETEAYTQDDPASHGFRGKTKRNASMFGCPGLGYVYLVYGMHYCFNVVADREGRAEAVLIRALEPLAGIALMEERRGSQDRKMLCSGPARLCQAMDITTREDGIDLLEDTIYILAGRIPEKLVQTARVGINRGRDLPYRFYIDGNKFVSRK